MALLSVAYVQSMTVWTMNTLCDKVIALAAPGRGLHVYISRMQPNSGWVGGWGCQQGQCGPEAGVVFQLPMYSCRDVFATDCNSHKFGSTGYI